MLDRLLDHLRRHPGVGVALQTPQQWDGVLDAVEEALASSPDQLAVDQLVAQDVQVCGCEGRLGRRRGWGALPRGQPSTLLQAVSRRVRVPTVPGTGVMTPPAPWHRPHHGCAQGCCPDGSDAAAARARGNQLFQAKDYAAAAAAYTGQLPAEC